MAHIQDRRSNFYSQKQSVRDELSAPLYLESAGDELIKSLAKKQRNKSTSLREQLEIVQNFEKGFDLNPLRQKGIASLNDFKKQVQPEPETSAILTAEGEDVPELHELMKITGLTRHELELSLCEKPNSRVSQLYKFAMGNRTGKGKRESLESKLVDHPINRLKEIEEECFGRGKKVAKLESKAQKDAGRLRKNKKQRKRKKKKGGETETAENPGKVFQVAEPRENSVSEKKEEELPKASTSRPSLWDVKDMKNWRESKKKSCEPQALYTIKNVENIGVELEKFYTRTVSHDLSWEDVLTKGELLKNTGAESQKVQGSSRNSSGNFTSTIGRRFPKVETPGKKAKLQSNPEKIGEVRSRKMQRERKKKNGGGKAFFIKV